jgi:hypothetical protein
MVDAPSGEASTWSAAPNNQNGMAALNGEDVSMNLAKLQVRIFGETRPVDGKRPRMYHPGP